MILANEKERQTERALHLNYSLLLNIFLFLFCFEIVSDIYQTHRDYIHPIMAHYSTLEQKIWQTQFTRTISSWSDGQGCHFPWVANIAGKENYIGLEKSLPQEDQLGQGTRAIARGLERIRKSGSLFFPRSLSLSALPQRTYASSSAGRDFMFSSHGKRRWQPTAPGSQEGTHEAHIELDTQFLLLY